MISNFLKNIRIGDKGFDQLCEDKIWKDEFYDEIIPIPHYHNSNLNNNDNN